MRKIIAILIAVILTCVPFAAFAHSDNGNLGAIPKTAAVPVVDGVKDGLYDNGLKIPVRTPMEGEADFGGLGGGADAWLLWDDAYLYVFINIDIAGTLSAPDNYDDVKTDAPWEVTNVEFFLDFTNEATGTEDQVKFRLDDKGFPTFEPSTEDIIAGDDTKAYFESAGVKSGKAYTIEMKIDINALKAYLSGTDADFGSNWAANKQIGIFVFSQEVSADGDTVYYCSSDLPGINKPPAFDFVSLGGNVVNEPAAEEEPPEVQPVEEPAPIVDDTPVSAAAPAPQTGDTVMIMIILIAFVLSFAGLIIRAKTIKN